MKVLNEEWKPVVGYENLYEVSNVGNVKSLFRYKKQLAIFLDKRGYQRCGLYINKLYSLKQVHRLVAEAFIDNPENKYAVNHIDGRKTNNRVDNLEWVTRAENAHHASINKLYKGRKGTKSNLSKLCDEDIITIRMLSITGLSQKQIADIYHLHQTTIHYILSNKTWSHCG